MHNNSILFYLFILIVFVNVFIFYSIRVTLVRKLTWVSRAHVHNASALHCTSLPTRSPPPFRPTHVTSPASYRGPARPPVGTPRRPSAFLRFCLCACLVRSLFSGFCVPRMSENIRFLTFSATSCVRGCVTEFSIPTR